MTAARPLAAEWPLRTADLLRTLYDVAEDHEADTLETLMLRAGYLWRCPDDDCRFANACDDDACDGCGQPRTGVDR